MRIVILHDHLSPDEEVPIDADQFVSAVPFGSETPEQVAGLIG